MFSALLEAKDEQGRRSAVEGDGALGRRDGDVESPDVRTTRERIRLVLQAVAFARAKQGDFSQIARVVEGLRRRRCGRYAFDYLVELGRAAGAVAGRLRSHKDARSGPGGRGARHHRQRGVAPGAHSLSRDKDSAWPRRPCGRAGAWCPRTPAQPRVP